LIGKNHPFINEYKKDLTLIKKYTIIKPMNNTVAKKIRKILNFDPNSADPTSKRVYSRAKKQYNKLSQGAKPLFIEELKNLYNNK